MHRSVRVCKCVCKSICVCVCECVSLSRHYALSAQQVFKSQRFVCPLPCLPVCVCVCLGHTNPWRVLSSFLPVSLSQQICPFEFSCHLAIVFRQFACSRNSSSSDLSALELSECKCGLWQVTLPFLFPSPLPLLPGKLPVSSLNTIKLLTICIMIFKLAGKLIVTQSVL